MPLFRFVMPQRLLVAISLACFLFGGAAAAKETDANDGSPTILRNVRIQPPGHIEPLHFGMLLSVQGDVGSRDTLDRESGFDVTDAQLLVAGKLEKGWGYFLQTEFVRSNPLLDRIIEWESGATGTRVGAGYFRSPFSGELLIAAPNLDFINRSQAVNAIAPARQIGLQLDQQILGDALVARLGVFNGEGRSTSSDNEFLYMLRLDGRVPYDDGVLIEYGINGAFSNDDEFDPLYGASNRGARIYLAGTDVRLTKGPLLVSAEGLYGSYTSKSNPNYESWGYQVSAGWIFSRLVQVVAR